MAIYTLIKKSEFQDSVSLMLVSRELTKLPGVEDVAVVMATEVNKSILSNAGLLSDEARQATSNDLVIVVKGEDDTIAELAFRKAEELLKKKISGSEGGEFKPKTIRGALSMHPDANVAVISVAGHYAADEAWEALLHGLHVHLFSDNVSLEDEIALKKYAHQHGLLLMGPGAGTTILNHVALGFANVVPAGPVGVISAAGTGLQEVTCLLARMGVGITQAIGTGGRDLKKEVGGLMMLQALEALQQDNNTRGILLISKPPDEEVIELILNRIEMGSKPTTVCFLGAEIDKLSGRKNVIPARTLQESALLAAQFFKPEIGDVKAILEVEDSHLNKQAQTIKASLNPQQQYLRGLFSGGTLCYESQVIWRELLNMPVYSNAPIPGSPVLLDPTKSYQHTAIDLGEEEFTVGRLHPMLDNDLRIRRLFQEVADAEVGVIILDVVLGFGAHPDPAPELAAAVKEAKALANKQGRDLVIVASVTGTEEDPQNLNRSISELEQADVIVCNSNASAARLAAFILQK